MTPENKMKDAMLPLLERIDKARIRIATGMGNMRIPAEATDPDIVLFNCKEEIERLTAENQQHEHTHACSICKKMSEDCQWYIKCNDEAEKRIEQLEAENQELRERWEMHLEHVRKFVAELYAIMIDPLESSDCKVEDTCKLLVEQAMADRQAIDTATRRISDLEAALREKEREVATKQARIMDYINAEYDPRSRWEAGLFEAIDRGVCELRGKKVGYTEALESKIISLEAQLKQEDDRP